MKKTSLLFLSMTLISPMSWATDPIIDLTAIDPAADPCQDFYKYACGNWIKNFQLPEDRSAYNRQSDGLGTAGEEQLHALLESYSHGDPKGFSKAPRKNAQKLGSFYRSCMNTDQIAKETPTFIEGQLNAVDAVQTSTDLAAFVAGLQLNGVNALFGFSSTPDMDDSSQVIGQLDQGGMSFSDRGYYFKNDPKSVEILGRFSEHISKLLQAAGEPLDQAQREASSVVDFETQLAYKALAVEDMQDATKLRHPMDLSGLRQLAPHFDWSTYFKTLGIDPAQKLNVTNPDFYTGLDAILSSTSVSEIKTYLKWQVLHRYASALSENFRNEDFAFWSKMLAGQKEPKPRWKSCTAATASVMRDALAEAYVESFSNAQVIKDNAETMINQIKASFGKNLDQLDWLDEATRNGAKLKLSKVTDKVGYPDQWRNFDGLSVDPSSYLTNINAGALFLSKIDLNKIGKPTDRAQWDMPPWEINAYYNPPSNEMVFPIGALVPPIFDLTASFGANFGSIGGGWMGHELTHGFDSDGHHYDGDGNLKNWWSPKTESEFNQRTQCLVDQANQYEVLPGLSVNGKQTLTENLADQGGVKMGYLAFLALTAGRDPAPNLGTLNERQQFWVAYAQSWCTKETDEHLRLQVSTDVHPPAEFRTNAVVMNRPEFAQDFNCKAGAKMAPVQRCSVW